MSSASRAVIAVLVVVAIGSIARVARFASREDARRAVRGEHEVRDRDIAFFHRRVTEDPLSAADRAQLAGLYLQRARDTGDWNDLVLAERAARAALELRTGRNGRAFLVLASSLLARHEFRASHEVVRELVALVPDEPAYRALLAELQVELGDYDSAAATFDSLLAHRRHLAVAPRLARWLELTGKVEAAEGLLRGAWQSVEGRVDLPTEQRAWFALRLSDFLQRHGRLKESAEVAHRGLATAPDDGRLMLVLARDAALRADWDEVLRQVRAAGTAADIAGMALAGDAALALGDSAGARAWWARAEQRGREQPEPFNRQWTLFRIEHGVALDETRAVLEREAGERRDVYGWDQLAMARLATGDVQGADRASREALRLGTADANLWWHASRVAARAGHAERARVLAARALGMNPAFHHLDAELARAVLARPGAGSASD